MRKADNRERGDLAVLPPLETGVLIAGVRCPCQPLPIRRGSIAVALTRQIPHAAWRER